jgi:1-phosphatidylinositol-4-phosphate 5-kinase
MKGFKLRKSLINVFAIVCSCSVYAFLKAGGNTGLNLYGMCSYKINSSSWVLGVIIFSIFLLLSWFTIIYFKKYVPDNPVFAEVRHNFLKFYLYYVITTNISWSLLVISNIVVGLNCTYFLNDNLTIFISIGNTTKLFTPIVLSYIRYKDPTL